MFIVILLFGLGMANDYLFSQHFAKQLSGCCTPPFMWGKRRLLRVLGPQSLTLNFTPFRGEIPKFDNTSSVRNDALEACLSSGNVTEFQREVCEFMHIRLPAEMKSRHQTPNGNTGDAVVILFGFLLLWFVGGVLC